MQHAVALSTRTMEGLVVAALAQSDADGALALPGLAPEHRPAVAARLQALARADAAVRRKFLRGALARPQLDPALADRLAAARVHPHVQPRVQPEVLAYLARAARER